MPGLASAPSPLRRSQCSPGFRCFADACSGWRGLCGSAAESREAVTNCQIRRSGCTTGTCARAPASVPKRADQRPQSKSDQSCQGSGSAGRGSSGARLRPGPEPHHRMVSEEPRRAAAGAGRHKAPLRGRGSESQGRGRGGTLSSGTPRRGASHNCEVWGSVSLSQNPGHRKACLCPLGFGSRADISSVGRHSVALQSRPSSNFPSQPRCGSPAQDRLRAGLQSVQAATVPALLGLHLPQQLGAMVPREQLQRRSLGTSRHSQPANGRGPRRALGQRGCSNGSTPAPLAPRRTLGRQWDRRLVRIAPAIQAVRPRCVAAPGVNCGYQM